jgi:hypothetical protein
MMKEKAYRTSFAVIALIVFGSMAVLAQSKTQHTHADQTASAQTVKKGQMPMNHDILKKDMSDMTNEPHQVLAMAFMQNIQTFAKTLSDQAQGDAPLSADFARAAVSEIQRNFDEANTHHQEHVKAMLPGRPSRMSGVTETDMRGSKLKAAIDTLDKDVQSYTLNSKQIANDCADVLRHLNEMAKMHRQE